MTNAQCQNPNDQGMTNDEIRMFNRNAEGVRGADRRPRPLKKRAALSGLRLNIRIGHWSLVIQPMGVWL
jgi:hypothetical protein